MAGTTGTHSSGTPQYCRLIGAGWATCEGPPPPPPPPQPHPQHPRRCLPSIHCCTSFKFITHKTCAFFSAIRGVSTDCWRVRLCCVYSRTPPPPFHFHTITCHPSPPLGRKWPVFFLGGKVCFSDRSLFLAVILMDPLTLARDSLERRLLLSAQFGKPRVTPLAKTPAKLKEERRRHLQLNSSAHPFPPCPHPPPPNGSLPNGSLFIAVPVLSG